MHSTVPVLLQVWTADFGKFLSEFATQSEAPPEQLVWCGTDSVVLYWEARSFPNTSYRRCPLTIVESHVSHIGQSDSSLGTS